MNSPVEISIVVPIYNSAETIQACVDSISNQSFRDWELILVDNGSTDGSLELIRSIAGTDSRIIAVIAPDRGVSSARNAGIRYAHGNYICFVDSDDIVDSDYLEILHSQSKHDLVICGYYIDNLNESGILLSSSKCIPERIDWAFGESKVKLISSFARGFFHLCCNKLLKHEIIVENNIYFRNISVNEDYTFVMEYLCYAKSIAVLDVPLYHWIRVAGRKTGVSSLPVNLLKIYNDSHAMTRTFFGDIESADKINYYTYELILYKYYEAYQSGTIDRQQLHGKLIEFHCNQLVKEAYRLHQPSTRGEKILYYLAKNGWYALHYLISQKKLL